MQGYIKSQHVLGVCYTKGYGVHKDYLMAYGWMSFVAESGDNFIIEVLNKIKSNLSDDDLNEAERLAPEWRLKDME